MKCCFCNAEIIGYGNSIRPLIRGRNAKCCDNCNRNIIIPYRFLEILSERENRNNNKRICVLPVGAVGCCCPGG